MLHKENQNYMPINPHLFNFDLSIIILHNIYQMKLLSLFLILVTVSSFNCPIQERLRTKVFSGMLLAEPQLNKDIQQLLYTQTFQRSLEKVPDVCLSLAGYEDQNVGYMKIFISRQTVSLQSFTLKVKSPFRSRWKKLYINFLVSTKSEIEIGIVSINNPQYDNNGFISLNYRPKYRINQGIKIRQFLLGIDVASQNGASLSITHQKTLVQASRINFIFSSKSCNINSMFLTVVVFDPQMPGVLFVDGSIEQNSLSTSTYVKIEKTYMEQMRVNFVGFSSLNAKNASGISINISFKNDFYLSIDSTDLRSVKVNYLLISFVDCGSCTGYPYYYNQTCYKSCPPRTLFKQNMCLPAECRNGFQYNSNNQCIPICGLNSYFSGKTCSCVSGFNMIDGLCNKCPVGTSYNYVTMVCQQICGPNSQYNTTDGKCYCFSGFYLIGDECQSCSAGTVYDQRNRRCLNRAISCGVNQVIAFGRCVCQNGYYKINSVCRQCPMYSSFNLSIGFCQCDTGYKMIQNQCVSNCKQNQYPVGPSCQCNVGYTRNVFGICDSVRCSENQYLASDGSCVCRVGFTRNFQGVCNRITISCSSNQVLIDRNCVCLPGYARNPDGLCYKILCLSGQTLDINLGKCISACAFGTAWDANYQKCIPQCAGGYIYDFKYGSCIPSCQSNYAWNGQTCVCSVGCQSVCPPGLYYNSIYQSCIPYKNCQNNQVWNGLTCVCMDGYLNINGNCQQGCQQYAQYVNGRCTCLTGYYEINNVCTIMSCSPGFRWDYQSQGCVSICTNNRVWNGGSCECPAGLIDFNGNCITQNPCPNDNEYFVSGRCQCNPGFYRINSRCTQCPPNTRWDSFRNICINFQPNCQNGKTWNGYQCQCPPGSTQTVFGGCTRVCGSNQIPTPNNQCECINGFVKNNFGECIKTCENGYDYVNGNCFPSCGKNQQWSGYSCVCLTGFQRFGPNICVPSCAQFQQRQGVSCECISGYKRSRDGTCRPQRNCEHPHRWRNGGCICANGYELSNANICVQICPPGFTRDNLNNCIPNLPTCRSDQMYVNGQCVCRSGSANVNGVCTQCPQYSQISSNGLCVCSVNNSPVYPGTRCPAPSCIDPNSVWDASTRGCKCKQLFQWIYGGCRVPATCNQNQIWNGQQCICTYGFVKVGRFCQAVSQRYYCPENSNFNGVNCQCNQGFYPVNNAFCQQCPFNSFWNGRQCGTTMGACMSGFTWDSNRRRCLNSNNRCSQNQYWDGANCRCNQGYFWINGVCSQCPSGTVYDGKQCTRGQVSSRCNDPYSYWNGATCVCIPGYWLLGGICVTCPSGYQWNGICCSPIPGLLRSVSLQSEGGDAVPVQIR